MAPTKGSAKGKGGDSKSSKPSTLSSTSRVSKKKDVKRPPPQEVKSKARTEPKQLKKTKKREYTEAELDLPKLNMITPAGVVKPKGKKKGKTFVDDQVGFAWSFWLAVLECLTNDGRNAGGNDDDSCYGQCRERRSD